MTAVAGEPRTIRVLPVLRRIPATLATLLALIVVGVVWQGLWLPFEDSSTYDLVAYGLPALSAGRWWTPFTGTLFVNAPWVYVLALGGFAGMAYLEFRRGWRLALGWFWIGQLFAVLASALLLLVLGSLPWAWAQAEAAALDVGPSGGTMACIAVAVGMLAQPWRVRAWLVLLGFVFVALTFWGELADLEHALAVLLVLFVDRTLRIQRTTIREQRLIAFIVVLVIAAIELITLLVPTDGMFGPTDAAATSFVDVALDVGVILLLANGLRRGRRWAWGWTVGYAILNIVTGALLVVIVATGLAARSDVSITGLGVSIATAVLWLLLLIYLIAVRHAFRARRKSPLGAQPPPTVAEMKDALRRDGGGTLSWMTTWDGNSYARIAESIVAYQRRSGVALVLADPIGPEPERSRAIMGFIAAAERAGLVPCFFSAGEQTRQAMPSGWRSLVVADDTVVDLPGLEFTGKKWAAVRTAVNRAAREKVVFRMSRFADEPWGVRQQLRAISEMWVGDKGLPEMGFTLGTLDEAEDPEVRLALAVSAAGDVEGFLSWLPVYGGAGRVRGWTLDLMRRRDGGFGPVMEFLIGSSAQLFAAEGAEVLSLSGAPLTHDYPPDAGSIAEVTDKLATILEPVYGFRSLHRFKEKFHPRYETMYLLYRDESDLARIAPGLTRAFLPDATLRQFAGAGLELVRGDRD